MLVMLYLKKKLKKHLKESKLLILYSEENKKREKENKIQLINRWEIRKKLRNQKLRKESRKKFFLTFIFIRKFIINIDNILKNVFYLNLAFI